VARSKGLSDISTLAYVTKVSRSIAPVVGDTFASTIAFAAYGKWSEKTLFRTVAQNTYKEIAEVLAKPKPGEMVDYTRYLSLAMALAAEFQKFWLKFPEGVPEDQLKLIAYLWHVEPKKRFPYDKALKIAKILNEAYLKLRGEKGA